MYIIVEIFHNDNECACQYIDDDDMRMFCLQNIVRCSDFLDEIEIDDELIDCKKAREYAIKEIKSTSSKNSSKYSLNKLIRILLDINQEQYNHKDYVRWSIEEIIYGTNIKNFKSK